MGATDPNACLICGEQCELDPKQGIWVHAHSKDMYCGTGDGGMAWPSRLGGQR